VDTSALNRLQAEIQKAKQSRAAAEQNLRDQKAAEYARALEQQAQAEQQRRAALAAQTAAQEQARYAQQLATQQAAEAVRRERSEAEIAARRQAIEEARPEVPVIVHGDTPPEGEAFAIVKAMQKRADSVLDFGTRVAEEP
jgi:hypothetical protein